MKFAVIGDPVAHSLSPKMHAAAYRALGMDHSYEAIRVRAGSVASELDRLRAGGYVGVNVTVPLKEEAMAWCQPDAFAKRAQAVNTIELQSRRGINTDGPGFARWLSGLMPTPGDILLLGAGGSARALAFALVEAGYRVTIWNRTSERAAGLAAVCGASAVFEPEPSDYQVVVNATAASMGTGGELPCPGGSGEGIAIDLYYSPSATAFMNAYENVGWRVFDGRELLVAQGALAFEFWLGVPAPLEAMRAAVGL